jgi:23S rRNA (uracil1939-C5)-methyltransferase
MAKKEKPPLQRAEKIQIQISGLTHAGDGVGRHNGMALFVPGTVPGETVLAEVTELKRNYARGRLLEIIASSPLRRQPACPHYAPCGGCQLQHIDYAEQLKLKTGLVKDSLVRLAGLDEAIVRPALGMESPWHYRNKAVFHVSERDGRYELGYYGEGSHTLTGLFKESGSLTEGCLLVDGALNELAAVMQRLLNIYGVMSGRQKQEGQFFRHVVLRKAAASGEMMAVLVTRSGQWPGEKAFAAELISAFPSLTSFMRNINDAASGPVFGRQYITLAGRDHIIDRLGSLSFRISPASFYQVNPVQMKVLYEKVLAYTGLTGAETVVDAYSGVGTIALYLAGRAKKVCGLELDALAVADARRNAALNQISNTEFLAGEAEKRLPELAAQGLRPDVVVLDPPRAGCSRAALEAVAAMSAPVLIYVSCDPGTLARDLRYLTGRGCQVREAQPVDMFPWTRCVECVVLIERK